MADFDFYVAFTQCNLFVEFSEMFVVRLLLSRMYVEHGTKKSKPPPKKLERFLGA